MDTIIFDVDDTLYDQALSFHRTFQAMVEGTYSYEEIDKIYRASRKHSEILFDKSEAGEITPLEWQTGRITAACEEFGIPIDQARAAAFHERYVEEQQKISLFEEVKELLDLLSGQGKQLAILTNGEEKHQAMKIRQLKLDKWIPQENTFISGSYGIAKPNKEIFDIVQENLKFETGQAVYIGDSYEKDIAGAKQAGWKAIWVNHRRRKMPEAAVVHADEEVFSARELLDLFIS